MIGRRRNVRELQNFIERAVILNREESYGCRSVTCKYPALRDARHAQRCRARGHILQILRETNGVIGGRRGAAVRLGLPRTTWSLKWNRLGVFHDPKHNPRYRRR